MLKLYVYGYLNRIQSPRCLEREAGRNVELTWLLDRLAPVAKINKLKKEVELTVFNQWEKINDTRQPR